MSSGVRFEWVFWGLHSYVEWIILLTCPLQLLDYLFQVTIFINHYHDMTITWIINFFVLIGVTYLSLGMALAGWITAMKRGEAVTLIKSKGSSQSNMTAQIILVILSLAVVVLLFYWLWIPLPFKPSAEHITVFKVVGFVLFIAGTLFTLWARQTLGRMWGISTSREVKLLPDHQLIDQGPYAMVRHPMYLGWWTAILGMALIYWTWIVLIMFVFSLVVFYKRAQREEAVLADRFGDQWQAYVQRSKFLVPWIF